ncbi:hypothetical protein [Lysobacter gummosus]|uniref:hypothetical protein n=1 Tax=Lysobacter gummosus TaxID=262324 RepID=UPI003642EFEF
MARRTGRRGPRSIDVGVGGRRCKARVQPDAAATPSGGARKAPNVLRIGNAQPVGARTGWISIH